MKIIILGAGQVGSSVAANLATENNDITVVDTNRDLLRELQDRIDIRTVVGRGSHPETLRQAGAEDTDLILAVTNSDETNMVACQVAQTLFRIPKKVARVRSQSYLMEENLFSATVQQKEPGSPAGSVLPVDVLISPEALVTEYVDRLLEYPGTLQVMDFADRRVQLVAVRAYHGGPLVGHELRELRDHIPNVDARVAAVFRRGRPTIPEGHTIIEPDDEVFFIAAREHIRKVMNEFLRREKPYRRVIIAGAGNIGLRLATALERRYQVLLIERSEQRAHEASELMSRGIVLWGDAADRELLLDENIEDTDVFCAVTDDDEANIISALQAKRLGARKVMALINRTAYVDLVESSEIDIAISPQQSTISSLLTHIRRGDIVKVHSLRRGAAEAIEAIAHGTAEESKVVGRRIEDIKLPPGTTIGAIVRGDEVIMAHHDTVIEAEDHVILFLVDKRRIRDVERLFQVDVTFI